MEKHIDMTAAQRLINDRYGERASALTRLGAGAWSRAFAFTLDGDEAVARFGVHRENFLKDQIMGSRGGPNLPIPRVLDVWENPAISSVVAERCHGGFLMRLRLGPPSARGGGGW